MKLRAIRFSDTTVAYLISLGCDNRLSCSDLFSVICFLRFDLLIRPSWDEAISFVLRSLWSKELTQLTGCSFVKTFAFLALVQPLFGAACIYNYFIILQLQFLGRRSEFIPLLKLFKLFPRWDYFTVPRLIKIRKKRERNLYISREGSL